MAVIIYCKDHRRRPIRLGFPLFLHDTQGTIPSGWCSSCGCEVFHVGEQQCVRCRKGKENGNE